MKILDIISEKKEWARNPNGTIKKFDDQGNYITGSELATIGFGDMDLSGASSDETPKVGSGSTGSVSPGKLATATSGTPKGATEDQMKKYGPSSTTKIDWREMRDYVSKKLSFNHAVAIVINSKWESTWMPGRWVHSDASQGPSGGLFMFHDADFSGRGFFSDMVAACGGPGQWQTNWRGQIDFALSYSKGQGPKFAAQKFRSPEEATHWFCYNFESPADKANQANMRAHEAHLYSK
jgi:hypothetical protein